MRRTHSPCRRGGTVALLIQALVAGPATAARSLEPRRAWAAATAGGGVPDVILNGTDERAQIIVAMAQQPRAEVVQPSMLRLYRWQNPFMPEVARWALG